MSIKKDELNEYFNNTRFIVLATVNGEQEPIQRSLGSFAAQDLTVYFSTHKATAKVEQIKQNSNVSILFQHEGQELPSFRNAVVVGTAKQITVREELDKAIELLGNRSPRFRDRALKGELSDNAFYRVEPSQIKVVDFAKGAGANSVEVISF